MHNGYAIKYFFCELLCFINVVCQLFLVERFLGGEFMTYGTKVSDDVCFQVNFMQFLKIMGQPSTFYL